ncbi:aminotransferase class I/II-fold pyridoxal phosphate-dependent enzyme, partial [Niveispirillum sp.]|uniref:aminotransferase class I/II-fold pyridoxal phosphate-dependent enzyme n=1 Tax=Niveispirillum sp. TaxID=1917217 RepID=UPI00345D0789
MESLPEEVLARTALAYICSPSNPQGAVATLERLQSYILLARPHGFVLVMDECYSEIYDRQRSVGAQQAALTLGDSFVSHERRRRPWSYWSSMYATLYPYGDIIRKKRKQILNKIIGI